MLGLLGGAAGVAIAYGGLRLLAAIGPENLPRLTEVRSTPGRSHSPSFCRCFPACCSVRFRCCVMLLRGGRSPCSARCVRQGGTRPAARTQPTRIAQVAMALVLLIGAVLMIRTFLAMRSVDPGFSDPTSLQVMRLSIPEHWWVIPRPSCVCRTAFSKSSLRFRRLFRGFRGFRPDEPRPTVLGPDPYRRRDYKAKNLHSASTTSFPRVLPHRRHKDRRRARLRMDRNIRPETDRHRVGEPRSRLSGSPNNAVGKRFREYPSMPWHEVWASFRTCVKMA